MKKLVLYSRYIFCLPLAFITAILLSGTFNVLQNFLNMIFCKLIIIVPYFLNCSGNFNQRTFLSDIIFLYVLIEASKIIAPKYKNHISLAVIILLILLYVFLILMTFLKLTNFENLLNNIVILIGLIIFGIIRFKKLKGE